MDLQESGDAANTTDKHVVVRKVYTNDRLNWVHVSARN
jgi:hypothetical protein